MSSPQTVRDSAKKLVNLLEKYPKDRIPHLVSFKDVQISRFRRVAGLPNLDDAGNSVKEKKPSLDEIKSIINRTSGPLGLNKEMLAKIQNKVLNEKFTEESINEQVRALSTITTNKFRNYYNVGDKLHKPAGNPSYYQRLIDTIEGKKTETMFTAMRTVLFGK
ncbi:cbp6p [Saccharomyces arboricola H-6]|uniref:Cbp6p n=1 Tax=Saccharomyces arboricola (strain H-6 / AS 2.3317 / CBS 10644) TaxID=1160507 RepID=J8PRI6_SACAR|nr:cbp6p [Saccharomyces arboricola H-6]